jgi:hypothetical protein
MNDTVESEETPVLKFGPRVHPRRLPNMFSRTPQIRSSFTTGESSDPAIREYNAGVKSRRQRQAERKANT